MPLLNAPAAYDAMDSAQAVALVGVLELHAAWDVLRGAPAADPRAAARQLLELQKRFEAYRAGRAGYAARFQTDQVPTLAAAGPDRLAKACRVLRTVLRQADGAACPVGTVARARRFADQIAERGGYEQATPAGVPATVGEAVRELDEIIRWCDARAAAA